jgi:hypothetical protein
MRKSNKLIQTINQYKIHAVLAACLFLITLGVVINHYVHAYTSDDVIIQTVLYQHTNLTGDGKAWLGEDNYVIKVPIYFLTQELFTNSRYVIFATLLIFDLIGFILFFYSAYYFFRKFKLDSKLSNLSMLWLASLSPALVAYFLYNPNLRNLEIGIAFLVLVLFDKYIDGNLNFVSVSKKVLAVALLVFLGIFFYSDPLFAYMLLLPLAVFFLVRIYLEKSRRKLIYSLLFLLGAVLIAAFTRKVFTHYGIMTHHTETKIIDFNQLWPNLNLLLESYFRIFAANFWGGNLLSAGSLLRFCNTVFMLIAVTGPLLLLRSEKFIFRKNPWAIFLLTQPLFLSAVYVLSNNTTLNGRGSIRFLVLLPFYAVFIIPMFLSYIKAPVVKALVPAFFIVVICLNSLYAAKLLALKHNNHPNTKNFMLIDTLKNLGLNKGYGNYWDSNINSYLSDYKINIVPVNCMEIQHWLMDDHALSIEAKKTFYIYNPTRTGECESPYVVTQVLGPPSQELGIGDSIVFVFNYDIKDKLKDAFFP